MGAKTSRECNLSVELNSKADLKNVAMTEGSRENVIVEDSIGELIEVEHTDGIILSRWRKGRLDNGSS